MNSVLVWFERIPKFEEERASVSRREGAGRPSASATDDDIRRAHELIVSDRPVTALKIDDPYAV